MNKSVEHARAVLGDWQSSLVCGDHSGYKAGFNQGMTEVGYMAHARRKFFDLHASSKSSLAERALQYIGQLYELSARSKT